MKCEDIDLAALLDADEEHFRSSDNVPEVAQHVESCEPCQTRLTNLAADEQQWRELQSWLSIGELSADVYAESLDARQRWSRSTTWSETMAKSLLSPPSHPEMLGRLGRYEIETLIGSGGMGVVFKAYDTELNRPVAVKLLAPFLAENTAARQRFAREARAAAAVVDDHVVPIHNVESENDPPFLVMQYIAGGSLQQRLDREGPMDVAEILRIGMQTASGLAAAHGQGLIHRDVKPSNILLDEGVERALLADFGLARAEDDACLTRSGFHPGTPHYMSPEQVRGEAIDPRSDLFSLGCVLYMLCTGHPPFRAETSYAVMRRITDDTPRPVREANPNIPEWLEVMVMKLLSKSPDDRYASALEVAELLKSCLAHTQHPTTTSLPEGVAKQFPRRSSPPTILQWIGAAAVALAVFLAGVLIVLESRKGTLTIQSEADGVPIRIKQGDDTVRRLKVSRVGETLRLYAGQYILEIDGPAKIYDIADGNVVVKRGETKIAKVTYADSGDHASSPLTEEQPLSTAVREFNNLHPSDAQGRPQQPLTISEVTTCLLWKLGGGELSEEVVRKFFLREHPRRGMALPAGWQFTGGLTRLRGEEGTFQTWEVNLETGGLSRPIPIRRTAIAPPTLLRKPIQEVDDARATPLATAIDEFNASQEERENTPPFLNRMIRYGSEPPLTLDEVLAALAHWQVRRDEADVDDATFAQLRRIAKTHRLPPGVSFEFTPTVENAIGQRFVISSIQLLVPCVDKQDSMDAVTIRHRFLALDRDHPEATHWSLPGINGIQAGVRLAPAQRTYQLGQVVDIEFLYRSVTGKEIPAELPRAFRYKKVSGIQLVDVSEDKQEFSDGSISTTIGEKPTVLRGLRMQICTAQESELKDGVNLKAITKPGESHYVRFVVPNPDVESAGEQLEISNRILFNTPSLKPPKILPLFEGHYYRHWGRFVPGHRRPTESTPDPGYIDPFMIGMSLGQAEKSRIPTYYAGGLQVTKVAPYSPAEAAGIEVGDILLSWEGHQIYGDDPEGNFLKFKTPARKLQELQESLEEMSKFFRMGSGGIRFVLLDHRTGEVIDITPWFGEVAGGGYTKSQLIQRAQQRKLLRNSEP